MNLSVAGIEYYLPAEAVTNAALATRFPEERLGIPSSAGALDFNLGRSATSTD